MPMISESADSNRYRVNLRLRNTLQHQGKRWSDVWHICYSRHPEPLSISNSCNCLLKEAAAPRPGLVWMLCREANCPYARASCNRRRWCAFLSYFLHPTAMASQIVAQNHVVPQILELNP